MTTKSEKLIEEKNEVKEIEKTKEIKDNSMDIVEIIMMPDPDISEDSSRIVSVNDLTYRIPYGETVKVERCIANVIAEYNENIKKLKEMKKEMKKSTRDGRLPVFARL